VIRILTVIAATGALIVPVPASSAAEHPGGFEREIARTDWMLDVQALAVGPGPRIFIAGATYPSPPGPRTHIRAYLPSGALDPTFDGDGMLDLEEQFRQVAALAVEPDGQILLGQTGDPPLLRRFNPDGRPDGSFGTDGVLEVDFPGELSFIDDVVVQRDKRILVAGHSSSSGSLTSQAYVSRYFADGSPDPIFGGDLPACRRSGFSTAASVLAGSHRSSSGRHAGAATWARRPRTAGAPSSRRTSGSACR
jgi:uncharacterized delta-60 repeat protein